MALPESQKAGILGILDTEEHYQCQFQDASLGTAPPSLFKPSSLHQKWNFLKAW